MADFMDNHQLQKEADELVVRNGKENRLQLIKWLQARDQQGRTWDEYQKFIDNSIAYFYHC